MSLEIKCVAIDDEPLALDLMKEYVSKFPELKWVQSFDDAISAGEYLRQNQIDLLFLDIQMPDISGLDLVRSLKKRPVIIFTTAHKKFAFEGFELEALDYLLKPIDFTRFSRTIQKAIEYFEYKSSPKKESEKNIFVYAEYRLVRINTIEIEYIESLDDYIKIHLTKGKPVLTLMTLKGILEILPAEFHRIHRSYIVSTNHVKSIQNRKILLASSIELPISDSYLHFIDAWKKG
ncbi:MAG TPA: LytTR family DNA-binding domain-containing protein [Puia sp.]|nr:LytTR family DNA-binding domain-containing protein [Puia sp.]